MVDKNRELAAARECLANAEATVQAYVLIEEIITAAIEDPF